MSTKLKLQILLGSTRAGRHADAVLRCFLPIAQEKFEVETLDLREWPLPIFQETMATIGDPRDPSYSDPIVKRWNQKIKEADAYLIVTPEYNHSVPGVLKNAIDSVILSHGFRHKPVAFVSYSAGVAAGVRAVEHLNQIMIETEAIPVRTQTLIPFIANAFAADGTLANPMLPITFTVMLEDLAWLGKTLKTARAEGQPPPAIVRIKAATAKK